MTVVCLSMVCMYTIAQTHAYELWQVLKCSIFNKLIKITEHQVLLLWFVVDLKKTDSLVPLANTATDHLLCVRLYTGH